MPLCGTRRKMARLHNLILMLKKQKKRRVVATKRKKKKSNKQMRTLKRRERRRQKPKLRKRLWKAIFMVFLNSQKKLTRPVTKTFQRHTKN